MRSGGVLLFFVSVIVALLIFLPNFNRTFYGFEYEDSFVNAAVALDKNLSNSIHKFRANPHNEIESGQIQGREFYSGHYVVYALYLWAIKHIFSIKSSHLMHKTGNLILIIVTLLSCLALSREDNRIQIFTTIILAFCTLPVVYIFNSGLKENLSFCLGIIAVVAALRNDKYINLVFVLVLIITLVKRENIVYIALPFIAVKRNQWLKYRMLIPLFIIVMVQIAINPFYTEGLESNDIGRSTFSLDFLSYQGPTYLASLFHFQGFLLLTILLTFISFSKRSLLISLIWTALFLTYCTHYRSKYSIELREITIFETYRYLTNSLPLFIGMIYFGKPRTITDKWFLKIAVFALAMSSLIFSLNKVNSYVEDEEFNYHYSANLIQELYPNSTILDNFPLISRLDHAGSKIMDIKVLDSISMQQNYKEPILIINRFSSDPIDVWLNKNNNLIKLDAPDLYILYHNKESSHKIE